MEKPNLSNSENGLDQSRRKFLLSAGTLGASALVGTALYQYLEEEAPAGNMVEGVIENIENREGVRFESEQMGYMAEAKLESNQIIFVDENNLPVGSPVNFSDAIPDTLQPGGVAISPPPYSWRKDVAEKLGADNSSAGRQVDRSHNVALEFKSALNYRDEPDLVAQIKSGEVKSFLDIVNYFAQKSVRGIDAEMSRVEYVEKEFRLSEKVPDIVRAELEHEIKSILPGLCAQESKFNNSLISPVGAKGIFQFMPKTWAGYGKKESDLNSLTEQTEVAGLLMSDIFRQLMHHSDESSLLMARDLFSSQSDFLRHFITPLMINSYNSGSSRLAAAVNQFFVPGRNLEGLVGKDVYLAMSDFAQGEEKGILREYKNDAREYVSRAYALSRVL